MKITRHRNRILEALHRWFEVHQSGPTLEELCLELGMSKKQKATLQRWLQTIRGTDVEWDNHIPRSLRLVEEQTNSNTFSLLAITDTLRYLATGLMEWEQLLVSQRVKIPEALRMGMSRVFLTSLLAGDETAPGDLASFFAWAEKPFLDWKPAQSCPEFAPGLSLLENGELTEFTWQWAVDGKDIEAQIQQKVMEEVLNYARREGLDNEYRYLRDLIISKPVLSYQEYRSLLKSNSPVKALSNFIPRIYLMEIDQEYYYCPRCLYPQRLDSSNRYRCQSKWCNQLAVAANLYPLSVLSNQKAEIMKVVSLGIYRYVTLPGLWELKLAKALQKLGARVTLWPDIDSYDLKVEFSTKCFWAIDFKDWCSLDRQRLLKVKLCFGAEKTLIVFPDEREEQLRIKVVRSQLEPELKGVKMRLFSEVIREASELLERKNMRDIQRWSRDLRKLIKASIELKSYTKKEAKIISATIVEVELGLTLLRLIAPQESALSLPILLQGYQFILDKFSEHKLMIQRARFYLIRRKGRQWKISLEKYLELPETLKIFSLTQLTYIPRLTQASIYPQRLQLYQDTLSTTPTHKQIKVNLAKVGKYSLTIYPPGKPKLKISLYLLELPKCNQNFSYFSGGNLTKKPLSINLKDLVRDAQSMDKILKDKGDQEQNYEQRIKQIIVKKFQGKKRVILFKQEQYKLRKLFI